MLLPELRDPRGSASWGEDAAFHFDLAAELGMCSLCAPGPLGLSGRKQPGPGGRFNLHLTSASCFLHGSLLVFHRGVPEDSLISAENLEGLRTNSCQN